jgi:hypothetical protein
LHRACQAWLLNGANYPLVAQPTRAAENNMKKTTKRKKTDELRPAYDLTKLKGGQRGKYLQRYRSGTNLVLLSPDVAAHFRDAQSVNSALRTVIRASKRST